jgi:hypothetical protein
VFIYEYEVEQTGRGEVSALLRSYVMRHSTATDSSKR